MGYLNEEELEVVKAMESHGGSFVRALAECFRRADAYNKAKLKEAFAVYWRQYQQMAGINPEIPQPEGTGGYQTNVDEHIARVSEDTCAKCGRIRGDKVFGHISDPCRCIRKDKPVQWDHSIAEQASQDMKEGRFSGDAYLN